MYTRLNRSNATMLMVSIVLALLLVLNYSSAQWQPAPANPPSGNIEVPVHVGAANQVKTGRLGASQFVAADRMRSDLYCDIKGANCVTYEDLYNVVNGSGSYSTSGEADSI